MARRRSLVRAIVAAAVAGAALAAVAAPVGAQEARSSRGSSSGGREDRGGFSFGGVISGRLNLLGGTDGEDVRPQPSLPAPPSGAVFAPQRLDKTTPPLIEGLKIQKQAPAQPAKPAPAAPANPPAAAAPPVAAPAPVIKQTLTLAATFDDHGPGIPSGVKWRVFTDQPDANGEHLLVAESTDATPKFDLDPGAYIVHAVYGLVSAAKYVTVKATQPAQQTLVLKAGGVRLTALVGDVRPPEAAVSFKLTRDEGGVARTVADHVKPGSLLRLPAGSYHVVSNYGDANATVEVDLQIGAGKLVDAQVHHKAAAVTLTLVRSPGGPELTNTSWTILTPGGDVIRDSIGALPKIVLAEGDYVAIARHDGRMYQQPFAVRAGADESVTVSAAAAN